MVKNDVDDGFGARSGDKAGSKAYVHVMASGETGSKRGVTIASEKVKHLQILLGMPPRLTRVDRTGVIKQQNRGTR